MRRNKQEVSNFDSYTWSSGHIHQHPSVDPMQGPRIMPSPTHPSLMHAGSMHPNSWSTSTNLPLSSITYISYPPRQHGTNTIRRSHQRSLSGRPPANYVNRSLPWSTHHPRRPPKYRPKVSYQTYIVKPVHLMRKPPTWRGSYKSPSKSGLGKYLSRIKLNIPRNPTLLLRVNPSITYQSHRSASPSYDLRFHPIAAYDLQLRSQDAPLSPVYLYQYASSPRTPRINLWHRKLPWSITVDTTTPRGVTVEDLLVGIYETLQTPIGHHEYYTVALTTKDREMVDMAFQKRCRGDPNEIRKGVRRVDFLGGEISFNGILRAKNGTWEIKTAAPVRQRMILE